MTRKINAPVIIPDTPEVRDELRRIADETIAANAKFMAEFEAALPFLPISDEIKREFADDIARRDRANRRKRNS